MSFSKAAEEMHVAQSAVSQQIRAMEEELGFALFERSTRRVSFTDAGQSFYVDCVKLMAGLDEALARAASKLNGKKNFLTVGIEGLMQCEVKAEALKAFERTHPEVDIIPKQIDRDRKYEDLLTGKIDVVFDIPKYYTLNPHIKKCGIVRNRHCLMVSKDHPLAGRDGVLVNLNLRRTILQVVLSGDRLAGQLPFFAHRHKTLMAQICHRYAKNKSTGFRPYHQVKILILYHIRQAVHRQGQAVRIL